MRSGFALVVALTLFPAPGGAQQVQADINLRLPPVHAQISLDHPDWQDGRYRDRDRNRDRDDDSRSGYGRGSGRVRVWIGPDRPRGEAPRYYRVPRRIDVKPWRKHHHDRHHCWDAGYRRLVFWLEPSSRRWFDAPRPGLVEVEGFAHDGELYFDDRPADNWEERYRH